MEKQIIGGGLVPNIPELVNRDFSYKKTFGAFTETKLPDDFTVDKQVWIKDQGSDDSCVGQAIAAVSETQEEVELSPWYTWSKTRQIMNASLQVFGADPRSACKAAIKYGFLQKNVDTIINRNEAANWKNYTANEDNLAKLHRKGSFFKIDGGKDLFESIIFCLDRHKVDKMTAFVGTYWQPEWTYSAGGIIGNQWGNTALPHAFKASGLKYINGNPYLVCQLSNGENIGDKGIFYFPREQVNRFLFAYAFYDLDPNIVKKETWTFLQSLKDFLVKLVDALVYEPTVLTNKSEPKSETKPEPMPEVKPEPKVSLWAKAIQDEEGYFLPGLDYQKGSRSWRNKNPGNLKNTELTYGFGAIGVDSDNFCIYPSYEVGFKALCSFLTLAAEDKLKPYHDTRDLKSFTKKYAEPPNDNYVNNIAAKLKVAPSIQIKFLI